MEKHMVRVLQTVPVLYNVKRFIVEKPDGYTFTSGQATDISINKPGLEEEVRPFTFTCLNSDHYLEFTIKIYSDHDGVTNKLQDIIAGDELIVHEVFGTIGYKGSGLFIAGGAGITPFISIFRQLKKDNLLNGNTLLFANHSEKDIILKQELDDLLGERHIDVLSDTGRKIDKELLKSFVSADQSYYYLCGPDEFVKDIKNNLIELGVNESQLVYEK